MEIIVNTLSRFWYSMTISPRQCLPRVNPWPPSLNFLIVFARLTTQLCAGLGHALSFSLYQWRSVGGEETNDNWSTARPHLRPSGRLEWQPRPAILAAERWNTAGTEAQLCGRGPDCYFATDELMFLTHFALHREVYYLLCSAIYITETSNHSC